MKKLLVFLLFFVLLLTFHCKKESTTNDEFQESIEYMEPDVEEGLDFNRMKYIVDSSKSIDVDVFFAISVLHKRYIQQFQEDVKDKSEEQQKLFFDGKKLEFFNSIKYSEKEYNDFMLQNPSKMNDYINSHREISEYLLSIN